LSSKPGFAAALARIEIMKTAHKTDTAMTAFLIPASFF
jgi:hypothetical protein